MSKRFLLLIAAMVLCMSVFVGCSGDDGKDADTGAIIATLEERIAELQAQLEESLSADLRAQLEAEIEALQKQLDEASGVVTGAVTGGPADDLGYSNYNVAVEGDDVVITFNVTYVANGRGFADYTGVNAVYNARQYRDGETGSYAYERNRLTSGMDLTLINASTGLYEVRFADAATADAGTTAGKSILDLYNMASGALPFDSDMMVTFTYGDAGLSTGEDPYRKRYLVVHSKQGEGLGRNLVSNHACYNCHADDIFNRGSDSALELQAVQDDTTSGARRGYHYATAPGDVVDSCVTCHGYNGNLARYVHGIHASSSSDSIVIKPQTVNASGSVTLPSFTYEISYPGSLENCAACHDTEEGRTITNDENFTFVNCVSCHGGAISVGTPATIVSNLDDWTDGWAWTVPAIKDMHEPYGAATVCSQCHTTGGIGRSFAKMHTGWDPVLKKAEEFRYVVDSVDVDSVAGTATAVWYVENPATGAKYNLLNADVAVAPIFGALSLWTAYGFDDDWTNEGRNRARPDNTNLLFVASGSGNTAVLGTNTTNVYSTANNTMATTFTVTADAVENIGAVVIQGRPRVQLEYPTVEVVAPPVGSIAQAFNLDDGETFTRRSTIDDAKCNACHGAFVYHGSNRIVGGELGVQMCGVCHTSSTLTNNAALAVRDMKTLAHEIHANSKYYPQSINTCEACHSFKEDDDRFEANFAVSLDKAIATTVGYGVDSLSRTDDAVIGAVQSTCLSCHVSSSVKAHAEQMGLPSTGVVRNKFTQETNDSCLVCHGDVHIKFKD